MLVNMDQSTTLASSPLAVQRELETEYELLRKYPADKTVDEHLQRWKWFERRLRTFNIFTTGGELQPVLGLIQSFQQGFPLDSCCRAQTIATMLVEERPIKLDMEVEFWATLFHNKRVVCFPPTKGSKAADGATSAGMDEQDQQKQSPKEQQAPKQSQRCPCGCTHSPVQCWYFNSDCPRPAGWKPKKKVADRINKALRDDDELKKRIDQQIAAAKQPNNGLILGAPAPATSSGDHERGELEPCTPLSVHAHAPPAREKHPLFTSVIHTCGTNIHIANASMKHRILQSRPADPESFAQAGSIFRPQAIVSVWVKITTGKGKLRLDNVWYIPEFPWNLVCSQKLADAGIHYDSSQPGLLLRQDRNGKWNTFSTMTMNSFELWAIETLSSNSGNSSEGAADDLLGYPRSIACTVISYPSQ